jgi:hypothetical protein
VGKAIVHSSCTFEPRSAALANNHNANADYNNGDDEDDSYENDDCEDNGTGLSGTSRLGKRSKIHDPKIRYTQMLQLKSDSTGLI